jgi:hypothetical protein
MTTPKTPAFVLALLAVTFALPLAVTLSWASTQVEVEEDAVSDELPTDASAPPEQNFQGILYRTGGFGSDEREALNTACRALSVKILFAHKGEGDFVAGVAVLVTDPKGKKVFEAKDTGPVLCVDLPKGGKFKVEASLNGASQSQTVTAGHDQKQIAFYF